MKIEKLNDNSLKRRKFLCTLICVVLLLIIVSLFLSHATYRNTQSVQVATGSINYSSADFNIIAMYDQNGNELTIMPSSGYIIDEEKSYCTVNGVKDTNASLYTNNNGEHVIANLQKRSKCYLIFEQIIYSKDTILVNNGGATAIEAKTATFSKTSCAANTNCANKIKCTTSCGEATNGMYAAADDDGTSYYYRGSVSNNWVSFGGFYWRIIRINGDGTIRLIYNGTSAGATGTSAQISTSKYYTSYDNNAYVGYKWTLNSVHGTGTDSTIKSAVDSWYSTNIVNKNDTNGKSYSTYVDSNGGFCNDRYPSTSSSSSNGSGGTGTTSTYYASYIRLITNKTPSLKCTESADLFTISGAKKPDGTTAKGNGALTYPVGLITADEVAYAGGVVESDNYGYWLYTGQFYWTMSPSFYDNGGDPDSDYYAGVFEVDTVGSLVGMWVDLSEGVRPVINLKADTQLTGSGTSSDPYKVVGAS